MFRIFVLLFSHLRLILRKIDKNIFSTFKRRGIYFNLREIQGEYKMYILILHFFAMY